MADFRIDVSFFAHTKTKRLKKALGLEGVVALLQLWAYAAANKHDATKVYSVEDIELAVDWAGEPGSLVSVLAAVRYVDEVPSGYAIHEWASHNGYAATAAKRSEAGRNAAAVRWNSKRLCGGNADACEPQSDGDTAAMRTHAESNAPSPFPSPSPLPEEEKDILPREMPKAPSVGIALPCEDGTEYPYPADWLATMRTAYPLVDIPTEAAKARAWLESSPQRKKTKRGMKKFFNTWLAKANETAVQAIQASAPPKTVGRKMTAADSAIPSWSPLAQHPAPPT